jgi:hypothetical protein
MQPRQDKNLLYRHNLINQSTRSFVLFESPFTTVLTVIRGHPSLVSLVRRSKEEVQRRKTKFAMYACTNSTGSLVNFFSSVKSVNKNIQLVEKHNNASADF